MSNSGSPAASAARLWDQYWAFFHNLFIGNLGVSLRYADWSVNELVANALPISLSIGWLALVLGTIMGVLLGLVAALNQHSWLDYCVMFVGSMGLAIPSFVIGPVLIMILSMWIPLLPAGGWNDYDWRYMVMPVTLLMIMVMANLARVMRDSMLEVMTTTYIRMAMAKGLPKHRVILHHALKPALIPVVTMIGPLALETVTAALVVETIFSLPSLGRLIVNGAANRDYTLVLGLVVFMTCIVVILNLLTDLAYTYMDARLRLRYRS